jgi:hypothetical protein
MTVRLGSSTSTPGVARRLLPQVDLARTVRRPLYHCDDDANLHHLQIDSTALSLKLCVDVIATAYDAQPEPTRALGQPAPALTLGSNPLIPYRLVSAMVLGEPRRSAKAMLPLLKD